MPVFSPQLMKKVEQILALQIFFKDVVEEKDRNTVVSGQFESISQTTFKTKVISEQSL